MSHFILLKDKLLGEGSFGKVYQCRWYGSPAAAKLFNAVQGNEPNEVSREIAVIRELRNDYIVQFFGTAYYNDKLCLITSYADKGSLFQALHSHMLSEELKPSIITGLIRGMQYLKGNNVVHRDLKSLNVLLDNNYTPKICDFGLARLKMTSTTTTTNPLSARGTTRWMAPELFQIRPRYSFASDVYALGVVIWEILTEQLPYTDTFDGQTIINFITSGQTEVIPDAFPEHYRSIIINCWHYRPEDRITIEEISNVNDEAPEQMNTANENPVSDIEISASVQNADTSLECASSEQQPIIHSPIQGRNISEEPVSTDYATVLDQYLLQTSGDLDTSNHLALLLKDHGGKFTQWIKAATEQGGSDAVTVLGEMYYHGYGISQDYQAAFKQFSMVAKDKKAFNNIIQPGNARAQNCLGCMYANGRGVKQNDIIAAKFFARAAEQGNPEAQFRLGDMYANGHGVPQDDTKAAEYFKKAAEQGNAMAQNSLGWMYTNGRGVEHNDKTAVEWYTKAAEQGYATAQNNLGRMYKNGRGAIQNDKEAVQWFMKAAKQGNAIAQNSLGWMYLNGRGVQQHEDKAFKFFTEAAEQDNAEAQFHLGDMHANGRGVSQNDYKACCYFTKAAKQGYAEAQNSLGWMYQYGRGVPRDCVKAAEWYTKAADQDNAIAQFNLGLMHQSGQGVRQNNKKAAELFRKAAEQCNAGAQYILGEMYLAGRGVPKDEKKAAEWMAKAAEQGNSDAQIKLGQMYQSDQDVLQNDRAHTQWDYYGTSEFQWSRYGTCLLL